MNVFITDFVLILDLFTLFKIFPLPPSPRTPLTVPGRAWASAAGQTCVLRLDDFARSKGFTQRKYFVTFYSPRMNILCLAGWFFSLFGSFLALQLLLFVFFLLRFLFFLFFSLFHLFGLSFFASDTITIVELTT